MRQGICPVTSRYITDLFVTVPEKTLAKMSDRAMAPWQVHLDEFFISQRILLCVNYSIRTLLPLIFDAEPFKETAIALRNQPIIVDPEELPDAYEAIKGLYDKIDAVLDSDLGENLGENLSDTDRERWELAEEVLNSVRWTVEAGMQGSTIVGPLVVNVMDLLSGWFGWDRMADFAEALFDELLNIHLAFN